MDNFLS